MPNYAPCRRADDDQLHLCHPSQPDVTLCGQPSDAPQTDIGERNLCSQCARVFLRTLSRLAGSSGVGVIEVSVQPAS